MNIREILDKKASTLGVMLSEFANPNITRIFQEAGFQFVIIDDEHGYFDFTQLAALIGVASGRDFPMIVRIPGVSREYITKVLDMGANGILVPMVNTPEQAMEIVSYSKYTPLGKRGISTTRAHTNYNPPPLKAYLPMANRNTATIIQLETAQAVNNAEKIIQTPGIDAVMIGPNDLAADLGVPGEVSSPVVLEAVEHVAAICRACSKPAGVITGNAQLISFSRQHGFTLFSVGSELDLLLKGSKSRVADFFARQ